MWVLRDKSLPRAGRAGRSSINSFTSVCCSSNSDTAKWGQRRARAACAFQKQNDFPAFHTPDVCSCIQGKQAPSLHVIDRLIVRPQPRGLFVGLPFPAYLAGIPKAKVSSFAPFPVSPVSPASCPRHLALFGHAPSSPPKPRCHQHFRYASCPTPEQIIKHQQNAPQSSLRVKLYAFLEKKIHTTKNTRKVHVGKLVRSITPNQTKINKQNAKQTGSNQDQKMHRWWKRSMQTTQHTSTQQNIFFSNVQTFEKIHQYIMIFLNK